MKNNYKTLWGIITLCGVLLIVLPFIFISISDIRVFLHSWLQIINLEENHFLSLWITSWGVIVAICGLYQITITQRQLESSQEQVDISRKELLEQIKFNEDSLIKHQKQLDLMVKQVLDEKFNVLKSELSSKNEAIQLIAVTELHRFALNHDEYRRAICDIFCAFIHSESKSNELNTRKYIKKIIYFLFVEKSYIFDEYEKDLTYSNLSDICIINGRIKKVNFSGSRIVNCVVHNSQISECIFNNVQMNDSLLKTTNIKRTDFQNCIFSSVTFNKAHIINLMFCKTKIHNSIFGNCRIMNVNFEDTEIQETQFSKTKFSDKCNMESSQIINTTFSFPSLKHKNTFKLYLSQSHLSKSNEEGNIIKID